MKLWKRIQDKIGPRKRFSISKQRVAQMTEQLQPWWVDECAAYGEREDASFDTNSALLAANQQDELHLSTILSIFYGQNIVDTNCGIGILV